MILFWLLALSCRAADWSIEVEQITRGPRHHLFGYIGHVQNIAFNGDGRYIVALRVGFQDHLPRPAEAAEIVLIDTRRNYAVERIDRTHAWNFQQGTMFYWNPRQAATQLFFNDRDPKTNRVFTVLYDIAQRRRMREFRFDDTPVGNGGVAQTGGAYLGINYGRMARLRPVTGYPDAYDWNPHTPAPDNDGLFRIDTATGAKRLLVSFRQLADAIRPLRPGVDGKALFLNHTLWSRDDSRIYFFVRADFDNRERRLDIPCSIRPDGTGLTIHRQHIGGHPEWASGTGIIGAVNGQQVIYDVDEQKVVSVIGGAETFPEPGGDVALSPDTRWLVNGYRKGEENFYIVYQRADRSWRKTPGYSHPGRTSGDLRVDAAPTWNRASDAILFPAVAADDTRQLFLLRIRQ